MHPTRQAAEPDPEAPADRHADRSHGRPWSRGLLITLGVVDLGQGLLRGRVRGFGSAASTLPILCHQQRCSLVSGETSRIAFQNPSAPSPTGSTPLARHCSAELRRGPAEMGE
jgi:hypothetical protein